MNDSLDRLMYSFVVEDVLKGFFVYVPPGYVACVYDLGRGVLKKCLLPGLHLKVPFWQRAKLFNTQTLEYRLSKDFNLKNVRAMGDIPVSAITLDGKAISIEGTILLRLDINQIPNIWQNIGEDFVDKIVRPTVRSRLRMIASRFSYQDLITNQRDAVEMQLKDELERIFYPRGIKVENVLLSEIGKPRGGEGEE
ncbi:MAG: HflC/HflK family protein [Parcubacteria group bacterium GW2011_GWC2_45_7]|nr:MAG: HflC/HflK family protein [Parcubacteria group bacterium GW2011_GWC2_45_7]KKU73341.1 MAG: HflC/HflK family protein [Parcubacteria group bacterium GW2011_GWA2_47_26]